MYFCFMATYKPNQKIALTHLGHTNIYTIRRESNKAIFLSIGRVTVNRKSFTWRKKIPMRYKQGFIKGAYLEIIQYNNKVEQFIWMRKDFLAYLESLGRAKLIA